MSPDYLADLTKTKNDLVYISDSSSASDESNIDLQHMKTDNHFETKCLSYTDLKKETATSVYVTKISSKIFSNQIKTEIRDFSVKSQ